MSTVREELLAMRGTILDRLSKTPDGRELTAIDKAIAALDGIQSGGGVQKKKAKKKTKERAEGEQPAAPKRGRGRPPGSKNKPKEGTAPRKEEQEKVVKLPELLVTLSQQSNKPMELADFVKLSHDFGYKSKAANFSNMVYQSLMKLVKTGVMTKNSETRCYEVSKVA
jgi:hypothetical protein